MDYEKKYKEALERAKEKYTTCYSPALLEYIFPELKENKDIEIKKDIISNLKRYIKCVKDGYDAPSAKNFVIKEIEKQIAWLEEQDNKSVNIDIESMVSSYKQRLKKNYGVTENNSLVNMYLTAFRRGVENTLEELNLKKLENQDEPNPYSGVSFDYNGHTWGMCARDGGVEILVDGEIKEKVFLDNKPQGKTALEAIKEEKVDNQNCINSADNLEPKFKVRYAGGEYNVLDVKDIAGVTFYGIEDEPNHIDYVKAVNCEIISGYGIKENGYPYPTKPSMFSEQKPADKNEPKFNVGDWVVFDNSNVKHITSVGTHGYTFDDGDYLLHDECDKIAHLWSIADAKNGDVLLFEGFYTI